MKGSLVIFPRDGEPVALYDIQEMVIDHLEARRRDEAVWVQSEHLQVGRFPPDIVQTLSGLPLLSVNEITADDQLLRTSITKDEGRGKVCL